MIKNFELKSLAAEEQMIVAIGYNPIRLFIPISFDNLCAPDRMRTVPILLMRPIKKKRNQKPYLYFAG